MNASTLKSIEIPAYMEDLADRLFLAQTRGRKSITIQDEEVTVEQVSWLVANGYRLAYNDTTKDAEIIWK